VLDDTRPERSFLLLAGAGTAGRMTAEEIGKMNLRGVRLVVLSACETARAPDGGAGGLAGLSAALLGAGADAVVGSLWRVDDGLTAPLMVAFHREYARTGDAAAALRASQLTLLRSPDTRLRSPAAWAGFVAIRG
jgi:CHAT domain-containing protein